MDLNALNRRVLERLYQRGVCPETLRLPIVSRTKFPLNSCSVTGLDVTVVDSSIRRVWLDNGKWGSGEHLGEVPVVRRAVSLTQWRKYR